ncbi:ATP-binding protein [Candidatus Micrarchaeota archaeon]|nr:ATP-binding protein [Candidatus Micrarchaeota archaeon]
MKKTELLKILYEWNPWEKELDGGIIRKRYLDRLKRLIRTKQIITITGPRRSGKSTLLKQYMNSIPQKNRHKILYVNFEESRFINPTLELLNEIYDVYRANVNPNEKVYILLDEVHKVKGWERFVRSIHERSETESIIITSSVSELISNEYGELLTGRHVDMRVYPLDFCEFLVFKKIITGKKNELIFKQNEIIKAAREYLTWGGFPRIVLSNEKKELLSAYFTDVINRDIVYRYRINKIDKLNTLAKYYINNTANLHSFNKISKFLKLSNDTVERFSRYFEEVYLLYFIKIFSHSIKQQAVNPKKVYCIDNGLIESEGLKFIDNTNKKLENAVFLHLLFKGVKPYYLKNSYEVDFYFDNTAIQVCYELNGSTDREVKALNKVNAENKYIITWNQDKKIGDIVVIPFWKWAIDYMGCQ